MRTPCVWPAVLCFSSLLFAACSIENLLKKAETNKYAETATKSKSSSAHSPTPAAMASPSSSAKPSPSGAAFRGDIAGKAGKQRLYEFLEENDKKIIRLDLLLSDEQLSELNDVNKGKRWYFDLAYPDKEGFNTGGELLIDISKGKGGLHLDGNHLTGQIKVTNWNGPHQGLMSINAKPITETADAKSATDGKTAPSPSAKPQAATRPRTTM